MDLRPEDLRNMSQGEIVNLLERGIIKLTMLNTMSLPMSKFDLPEYKQFESLRGQSISLSDASRKYDVPKKSISQWVDRGLIHVLERSEYRLLLDEADIAYCAYVRRQTPGRGKWLFNPDGTPYIKKKCE